MTVPYSSRKSVNPNPIVTSLTSNLVTTELISLPTYSSPAIVFSGIYFDGTDIRIKNAAGAVRTPYIQRDVAVLTRYKTGSTQNLPASTITTITFEAATTVNSQGDTGLSYSAGVFTNTSSLTKTYLILATIGSQGGVANYDRAVWILRGSNPATQPRFGNNQITITQTGNLVEQTVSAVLVVAPSETFRVQVFNDSASAATVLFDVTIQRTHITVTLL